MSLVSDIEEIVTRAKIPAHRKTPISPNVVVNLVTRYGPLPDPITEVVAKVGMAELFWGKGDYPNYNLFVCQKLQMDRVGPDEYYLNVGAWIYGGAVYYRWCPKEERYLGGVYGVRGSGLGKNFESIEHWFAACLKKVRREFTKTEWNDNLGMQGFKPSAER